MGEVSSTGIKTMLLKLDVKQNTDKTLTDLMRQLQSASTLKGSVVELTEEGDAIFTTNLGKFSLPNLFGLNKNDQIVLKNILENGKLSTQLVSVNDVRNEKTSQISLSFFVNSSPNSSANKFGSPIEVSINNNTNIAKTINGNLSYLNLVNLNKESLLFKLFENAQQNTKMEFKILKQEDIKSVNPYQVTAEIVEEKNQQQTIKTSFGMIKIPATNMSLGSRFILEIKSLNNINVDNSPFKTIVESLLFKLNINWNSLNSLFFSSDDIEFMQSALKNEHSNNFISKQLMQSPTPSSTFNVKSEVLAATFNDKNNFNELQPFNPNGKNAVQLQQQVNSADYRQNSKKLSSVNLSEANSRPNEESKKITPKTIHEKEVIRDLKNELINIKNNLYPAIKDEHNYWQQTFLPFPKNQEIEEKQIFFKRISKNTIRFIIETSLSEFGDVQFDGLVTLKDQDFVENFDLAVRFKNRIDKNLQSTISDIYLLNQNSTGIKGKLNFESVTDFISKD